MESGDGCCNCEEYSIEGGPFEQDGMFVTQEVSCTACGAKWTSAFKLVAIRDATIEDPENKDLTNGSYFEADDDGARRGAFVMECEVPVFEGCGKLLAAAKQVVSNWEQGDLAAAVRNLDLSIQEIEGKVSKRPPDVFLLVIEFPNGRNFFACEDSERAIDELYEFVSEYWHELPGEIGKIPSEKLDAIEIYYKEKEGEESYEMQALPLLSGRDEE